MTNGRANAKLKIDRTKYGVKYASKSFIKNVGDKMIYDEFDLEVNLIYTFRNIDGYLYNIFSDFNILDWPLLDCYVSKSK